LSKFLHFIDDENKDTAEQMNLVRVLLNYDHTDYIIYTLFFRENNHNNYPKEISKAGLVMTRKRVRDAICIFIKFKLVCSLSHEGFAPYCFYFANTVCTEVK
jgi:hypothetical protein